MFDCDVWLSLPLTRNLKILTLRLEEIKLDEFGRDDESPLHCVFCFLAEGYSDWYEWDVCSVVSTLYGFAY